MIFKTIKDESSNAIKSLSLFNKDLSVIKEDLTRGQTLSYSLFGKGINKSDIQAIRNYTNLIDSGTVSSNQAWAQTMGNCSVAAQQQTRACNGNVDALRALTAAQDKNILSVKATQTAYKGLAIAGNIVSGLLISAAVSAVVTGIDNFIHRVEKAKQEAKEALDAINESQSRLKEASSTIAENRDRFLELSEGVDQFSNNLTLSEKDYEEYISISQELAELFPQLISGYDNQGNALLDIGKNAEETNEKLNSLLETEQLLADQTLIDNMDDVAKGIAASVGENIDEIETMESQLSELQTNHHLVNFNLQNPEGVFHFKPDDFYKYGTELQKALDAAGAKYILKGHNIEITSATEEQLAYAQKQYDAFMETENRSYQASVAGLKKNIEEKKKINRRYYAQMTANLQVWTKQSYDYQYISAPMQKLVDTIVPSIDWSSLEEPPQTAAQYEDYIQKNILDPLMQIPEKYRTEATKLISEMMSFEQGNLDVLPIASKLQELLNGLGLTIDLTPVIQNEKEAKHKLQNSLDSILLTDAGSSHVAVDAVHNRGNEVKYIDSNFYEYDPEEYKKLTKYTEDFNEEQIELWAEVTYGCRDAESAIKAYEQALTKKPKTSIVDTVTQIKKELAPAFESLGNAYQEIFTADGFTLENVDTDMLSNLTDAFSGLENFNTSDLEELFAILTTSGSTADEVQRAFNDVASAYLYSTNTLENLNDETADTVVKLLEELHVENAQELVQKTLAGQNSQLAAQKDYLAQYSKQLSNATFLEQSEFILAGIKAGSYSEELAYLQVQKYLCGQTSLSSTEDINALLKLAEAAGITSKSIGRLAGLKAAYDKAQNSGQALFIANEMQKLQNEVKEEISGLNFQEKKPKTPASSPKSQTPSTASQAQTETETAESFNFIETLLSRLSSAFDKAKTLAENTFLSADKRAKAYGETLDIVTQQINAQQQAYKTYMDKANAVNLEETWAAKVRDGSIDISEVSDSGLKQRIKDYQTWYEKALACGKELDNLKKTQTELTQAKVKLKIEQYENLSDKAAGKNDRLNAWISLKESFGGSANVKNYNSMNNHNLSQIKYTNLENQALKELQKTVEKGSDAWYDYDKQINDNKISMRKLKQEIMENAKAAAALAKETAQKKIEKYDRQDEMTDAKIANATSSSSKNSLINDKFSNITKRQNAYDKAVTTDTKRFNKAKSTLNKFKSTKKNESLLKKIKKYTKKGEMIPSKLLEPASKLSDNGKLYKACANYNARLEALTSDQETAELFRETSKKEKRELALEQFNNISNEYDKKVSLLNHQTGAIDNQIAETEASGRKVNRSFYDTKKSINQQKLVTLTAQKDALTKNLSNIAYGTDEWYEAVDAIAQLTNSISECKTETYELNNAINELYFDEFYSISDAIDRMTSEQDMLRSLIAHEKNFDEDTGEFTEAGLANLGSLSANYYAAKEKQDNDAEMIERLRKIKESGALTDGELTFNSMEELDAKINEVYTKWQEDIKSTYDLETAISDFMKEKYQAELDALNNLISAKKESLQAEKDLRDYQKSISEKTENISRLKKRIAAYSGDTSQEGLAKLQKLQVELNEKQKDLQETEYDKYISDQEEMLDKLYQEYEEISTKKTDDFMNLVKEGLNTANSNTGQISAYLAEIATKYGYTIQNPVSGDKTVKDSTKETVAQKEQAANAQSGTKTDEQNSPKVGNALIDVPAPATRNTDNKKKTKLQIAKEYVKSHLSDAKKAKESYSDVNQIILKKYNNKILKTQNQKELAKLLGVTYDGSTKKGKLYKKLHSIHFPGFSQGGTVISTASIRQGIRENGDDAIVSVRRGETILTEAMCDSLNQCVENLRALTGDMSPQLRQLTSMPNANGLPQTAVMQNQAQYGDIAFNFTLPNVTDPENFLTAIKTSAKLQKAIQSVSVDRIYGGSRLDVQKIQ